MMRFWPFAAAALFGTGTAAHACTCENPATMSEADKQASARWMAERRMIIAEVERIERTDPAGPDVYKVIRPLIGSLGKEIRVGSRMVRLADGSLVEGPITSCDFTLAVGTRRIMAFAPNSPHATGTAPPCSVLARIAAQEQLAPAGMCTQFSLEAPGMIDRVRAILAKQR